MSANRRFSAVGAVLLVAALLSGCAGAAESGGSTSSAPPTSAAPLEGSAGRAVDLLPVVWHVVGATGAAKSTYLLFTANEVEVLQPKGFVLLAWATQGDAMATQVYGWSEALGTRGAPTVPWLTSATSFRQVDAGWVLLDRHGDRLAELRNDGPAPTSSTTITTPRPVNAFDRRRLTDAAAGPGAQTASAESLAGRWSVHGLDPEHALLTITRSGRWTIRGGCDSGTGQDLGGAGTLRPLSNGYLLLTSGAVAGVGCMTPTRKPPADAAALTRFVEARSLKLQNGRMTLFDRDGERIGALTRAG